MKNNRFQKTIDMRRKQAKKWQRQQQRHIRNECGRHIWRSLYRADLAAWQEDLGYYERSKVEAVERADRDHEWAIANGYPDNNWDDDYRAHGGYGLEEHLAKQPNPADYPPTRIRTDLYAGRAVPPQFAPYVETDNGQWVYDDDGAHVKEIRAKKIWRLRDSELKRLKRMGLIAARGRGRGLGANISSVLDLYDDLY